MARFQDALGCLITSVITEYAKDYFIEENKLKFSVNKNHITIKEDRKNYVVNVGKIYFTLRYEDDIYKLVNLLDELVQN